jgi:hypothetical protein
MSFVKESLADLERQADAKRRELSGSMTKLRLQLQPSNLSNEVAERLKSAASDVMHRASEKANTRTGRGTAVAGVALSALALGWGMRRPARSARLEGLPSVPQVSDDLPSRMERPRDRNLIRTAATLVTALTLGAGIAKIIPLSRSERNFLSSAGIEIRSACEQWAKRQVTQLLQPPLEGPFRPANAIALGIGLLLTGKDRK